jgi:hypothetical protein
MHIYNFSFKVGATFLCHLHIDDIARYTAADENYAVVMTSNSLSFIANICELNVLKIWYAFTLSSHWGKNTDKRKGGPQAAPLLIINLNFKPLYLFSV